ncbi:MAG: hypothetical protein GY853_11960 [PVC group bacterium]|nr:hypothetical protein [PVC group bacterium]
MKNKIITITVILLLIISSKHTNARNKEDNILMDDPSVEAAQEYIKDNDLERVYDALFPIRIQTPAAQPEDILGFPLKKQHSILQQDDKYMELGIIFYFNLYTKAIMDIEEYPNAREGKYIITLDENNNFTGWRLIKDYKELKDL